MTTEDLLREFLSDDHIERKYGISKDEASKWKVASQTDNKLINVIREAIVSYKEKPDSSIDAVARSVNKFLNK